VPIKGKHAIPSIVMGSAQYECNKIIIMFKIVWLDKMMGLVCEQLVADK
jgi:hypothetical protein